MVLRGRAPSYPEEQMVSSESLKVEFVSEHLATPPPPLAVTVITIIKLVIYLEQGHLIFWLPS